MFLTGFLLLLEQAGWCGGGCFLSRLLLCQTAPRRAQEGVGSPLAGWGFTPAEGEFPQALLAAAMGALARHSCPGWFSPSGPGLL